MHNIFNISLFIFLLLGTVSKLSAQCPTPTIYDLGLSVASDNPSWVNCIDNSATPDDFTLSLISPDDIVQYDIDWGDGSVNTTGNNWLAGTAVSHPYTQLGEFIVTISETDNGCTTVITGNLINDRKPGATATPPTLNSSGCTPHTLTFLNQTTNVSPFTEYEWDWGDGSIEGVTNPGDPGASGNALSHQYLPNTSDCGMEVTLTAQSLCQTTFVTFGPYDFWDYDTALVSASQTQICQGEQITFNDISDYNCVPGPRYIQWDLTAVGQGITTFVPAVPANQTKSAFINGPVGATFTINFADSNFCGIDYNSVTIEIIAPPTADIEVFDDTVCVGELATFNNLSSGGGSSFDWDFDDNSTRHDNNKRNRTHIYGMEGEYWVKIIVGIAGNPSCSSIDSVKITVLASPDLVLLSSIQESCDTTVVEFSQTHSVDALAINWNFGQGGGDTGEGPFNIQFDEEGIYVATVSTENLAGCTRVDRDTIRIYPNPIIVFSADSICLGDTSFFTNNSSIPFQQTNGLLRELWLNVNGSNVSDLTSLNNYPDSPDETAIITNFEFNTLGLNKYGTRTHGFIVPPETGFYTFWIAADDKAELWISESNDTANVQKIASVPGFTNFQQWTKFAEQKSATIMLEANKLYYIRALQKENAGGDHLSVGWQLPSGTLERPITSNRLKSFSNAFLVKDYLWDFGDNTNSTEETPFHVFTTAGDRFVKLTVSTHQCSTIDSIPVTVILGAQPDFELSDTVSCSPLSIEMVNTSQNATSYTWNLGEGGALINTNSVSDTIRKTYFNNDTTVKDFFVTLFANNSIGCAADLRKTIHVYPNPKASSEVVSPIPACAPLDVLFKNNSQGFTGVQYQWFIDGNVLNDNSDSLYHTYQNTTGGIVFDTVSLVSLSPLGCKDSVTKVVTVFPRSNYSINAPDTICADENVRISYNGPVNQQEWNISGQVSRFVPDFDYFFTNNTMTDSVYNLELYINSVFSCKDTLAKTIVVTPSLKAVLDVSDIELCAPFEVLFKNKSQGLTANQYQWTIGGNTLNDNSDSLYHTYNNTTGGIIFDIVSLVGISSFGCKDSVVQIITVYPKPSFSINAPDTVCADENINISYNGSASQQEWDLDGQGSFVTPNFSYSFVNDNVVDSVYELSLYVTSVFSCKDTVRKDIVVASVAQPNFELSDTISCSPLSVEIFNLSQNSVTYTWSLGEGTSVNTSNVSDTVRNIYINTDTVVKDLSVTLFAKNKIGCTESISKTVHIHPNPESNIEVFSPIPTCAPLAVLFKNSSKGFTGVQYQWMIADSLQNNNSDSVFYTYENTTESILYDTVSLVSVSLFGCKDSVTKVVTVFPRDTFSINAPDTICANESVIISYNGSASQQEWNISDQISRFVPEFNYHFTNNNVADSVYKLTLYLNSVFSCKDTVSKDIVVIAPLRADFNVDPISQEFPAVTVNIDNLSQGSILNYTWSFGDEDSSFVSNPVSHDYDTSGTFTINLKVENQHCVDSTQRLIQIFIPLPIASFTGGDTACIPHEISFSNTSVNGEEFLWDFGDNSTSTERNPTHTYLVAGEYSVKLKVSNSTGVDSVYQEDIVNVVAEPVAFFNTSPNISGEEIIAPATFFFKNQSLHASIYSWDFDDHGNHSNELNTSYTYTKAGVYEPTLIVSNSIGCTDTFTVFPAITVIEGGQIHIPNVFNPHANLSTNQVFKPVVFGNVSNFSMIIYNRWGEVVFTSKEIDDGWNGEYRGEIVEQGVYTYLIKIDFSSGGSERLLGDVTLLR